jgi:hypothetical protein
MSGLWRIAHLGSPVGLFGRCLFGDWLIERGLGGLEWVKNWSIENGLNIYKAFSRAEWLMRI